MEPFALFTLHFAQCASVLYLLYQWLFAPGVKKTSTNKKENNHDISSYKVKVVYDCERTVNGITAEKTDCKNKDKY